MSNKKDYENRCFSPNWIEIDLEDAARRQVKREDRLESKQRKDLKTLLKELGCPCEYLDEEAA